MGRCCDQQFVSLKLLSGGSEGRLDRVLKEHRHPFRCRWLISWAMVSGCGDEEGEKKGKGLLLRHGSDATRNGRDETWDVLIDGSLEIDVTNERVSGLL